MDQAPGVSAVLRGCLLALRHGPMERLGISQADEQPCASLGRKYMAGNCHAVVESDVCRQQQD